MVALVLLGVLFYRVYVYDPVAAQLGGRVTHFSIDFRNGPSVAKAIEWPEDVTAEQLEAAYEAYYASR